MSPHRPDPSTIGSFSFASYTMTKHSPSRCAKDFLVIEGKSRRLEGGMPLSGFGVIRGRRLSLFIEQCSKHYSYRVTSRVAPRITERADLFKLNPLETSLFAQLPGGGRFKRFIFVDKPAWESPSPLKRFMLAFDEQDSGAAMCAMKQYDVDRDRRPRMIVAVFSPRPCCLHQPVSFNRPVADRISQPSLSDVFPPIGHDRVPMPIADLRKHCSWRFHRPC